MAKAITGTRKLKIHPAADAWPMLPPDELQALADDIMTHGQRESIKTWNGQVIDGRNRLEACKLVKVTPDFEALDFENEAAVLAYIESENERRRHLTKGQRAIALARMYASNGRWPRGMRDRIVRSTNNSPQTVGLSQAAFLVANAPDLADAVMAGTQSLNAAYDDAKVRESQAKGDDKRLRELVELAPDLAEQVETNKLKLGEAYAAWMAREQQERLDRRNALEGWEPAYVQLLAAVSALEVLDASEWPVTLKQVQYLENMTSYLKGEIK